MSIDPPVASQASLCQLCWEALAGARDALIAFQKQAGYLPEQGAYSTRMTDAEIKLAQAVADIDRILLLAALPGDRGAWQPIETAPKNLEEVIVYDPDYGGVRMAQYEMHAKPPFWSIDVHDLTCGDGRTRVDQIKIEPTYWMPLPAPPVGTDPPRSKS